jgi:hypothetical protein
MTTEVLIQKVRDELDVFDERSEQFVATLKKVLQDNGETSTPQLAQEKFASHNITLAEYEALSRVEKRRYHDEAEKLNERWVENQLDRLQAKWIMVVEGQVVLHGATLDDYPDDEDFLALCKKTGWYPFLFVSSRVFAIEEHATLWHQTNEPRDDYPAVAIAITGNDNRFETEADFDSGAVDSYCPLELLVANGLVKIFANDRERTSKHLSRPFVYFFKRVWLELSDGNGASRRWQTTMICVDDWQSSPFTTINPARTFLLGRGVLFKLRPRLILDFDARLTEIEFKEAAS